MEAIAAEVASLDREGKDPREYAYLLFDARPPPLARLAASLLVVDENVSPEEAKRRIERAAEEAKREGRLLGAGGAMRAKTILTVLGDVAGPGSNVAMVEDWLAKPCPPIHARLVMLAETMFSLEHVPIVRAN